MGSRFSDWGRRHHSELLGKSSKHYFAFCLQKTDIHRFSASWYCSCKNAHRRGWRDSRLETFKHRVETLTHSGDHTRRMVRSKGEAGRRVHRRWSGQHVAGMAEGWNVAERRHVSGEGGWVEGAALGEVFQRVMHLFALFGFARHFSVSGLDSFLLHSQGSVNLNKDQFFFFFLLFCWLWNGAGFHTPSWVPLTAPAQGSAFRGPLPPTSSCLLPRDPESGRLGRQQSSDCRSLSVSETKRRQVRCSQQRLLIMSICISYLQEILPQGTWRSHGPYSRHPPNMTVFLW